MEPNHYGHPRDWAEVTVLLKFIFAMGNLLGLSRSGPNGSRGDSS